MDITITSIVSVAAAVIGAVVGGWIGYRASLSQWKQALAEERKRDLEDKREQIIYFAYELTEYVRNYALNSRYAPPLLAQSGRNPLKRILALTVISLPELRPDVEEIQAAISDLHGSKLPVPDALFNEVIDKCNRFGERVSKKLTGTKDNG